MKKNSFKKFVSLMRKSEMYFLEYDGTHYIIANSYLLLKVNAGIYKTYFHDTEKKMFPHITNKNMTLVFDRIDNKFVKANKKINLNKLFPVNENTCILTNAILQLKTCAANCYAVNADKPFVVTINNDFVKAFSDIFENHCTIYGGKKDYSPILFHDNFQDISGFILPIRDINNQETKHGILKQFNMV